MKKLTPRQYQILDFICIFIIENSFSPSYREISEKFGFTDARAYDIVASLVKKGYLIDAPISQRSLKIRKLASIYHGTLGELCLQIAPKGTAEIKGVSNATKLV